MLEVLFSLGSETLLVSLESLLLPASMNLMADRRVTRLACV